MRRLLPTALVWLAACAPRPAAPQPAHASLLGEVTFRGMCDASGAVALSGAQMVAADDEDNVLRAFDVERGGDALWGADVSAALGVPIKGKKHPRPAEVDLEAATVLGDRAYWITSHGRSSKGKRKPERLQFFATTVPAMEVVGDYDALLDDLLADPRYAGFELATASTLPPKRPGGLNIEGLTTTPDGELLIGFRSPVPGGRALIAPLRNPREVIDGGGPARFGEPIRLDLGGRGIRSLTWWRGRYLVIAGAADAAGGASWLYTWDGRGAPVALDVDLSAYNPEGFFSPEERDDVMLLSDDGARLVGELPCKEADADARSFRGVWIRIRPK